MIRRPPISTRTDTLFPYTTLFRSAVPLAKEMGAKRAVLLPVSAPFHCPLMQPAADAMAKALAEADLRTPLVPVYANVLAAPIADPDDIRADRKSTRLNSSQ